MFPANSVDRDKAALSLNRQFSRGIGARSFHLAWKHAA
jgi:hypothetical protein